MKSVIHTLHRGILTMYPCIYIHKLYPSIYTNYTRRIHKICFAHLFTQNVPQDTENIYKHRLYPQDTQFTHVSIYTNCTIVPQDTQHIYTHKLYPRRIHKIYPRIYIHKLYHFTTQHIYTHKLYPQDSQYLPTHLYTQLVTLYHTTYLYTQIVPAGFTIFTHASIYTNCTCRYRVG